jgi:PhnB protein
MANPVQAIPEGHRAAIPYLCIKDAAAAIDFYKRALGATETVRMAQPDGKVAHAEMRIGDAVIMLAEETPQMAWRSPHSIGGSPVMIHLYVEGVDAVARRAMGEGMKELRKVEDQFYGDRGGKFEDPFGHVWWLATHQEDVSPEEMKRRASAMFTGA